MVQLGRHKLLTPEEAAARLGVTRAAIDKRVSRGQLRPIAAQGVLFRLSDLKPASRGPKRHVERAAIRLPD